MTLKFTKAKELLGYQSALAQKVYEAVPIKTATDINHIHRWLLQQGRHLEFRVVEGCIHTLVEAGLVKHHRGTGFVREPVIVPDDIGNRNTLTVVETPENSEADMAIEVLEDDDPLAMIEELCKRMDDLKADMETVGLKISERLQQADESVAQVKQLRKLLKGLGDD